MRAFAITGMLTVAMIDSIMSGSLIRATPPWTRMSAGTRSSAMTDTAPASSAILACSAVTTSMMTPPLSISAMPRLTRAVPVPLVPNSELLLSLDTVKTSVVRLWGVRRTCGVRHPWYDRSAPGSGRERGGRRLVGQQDPHLTGRERQRLAGQRRPVRAAGLRGPRPASLVRTAVAEHDRLPMPERLGHRRDPAELVAIARGVDVHVLDDDCGAAQPLAVGHGLDAVHGEQPTFRRGAPHEHGLGAGPANGRGAAGGAATGHGRPEPEADVLGLGRVGCALEQLVTVAEEVVRRVPRGVTPIALGAGVTTDVVQVRRRDHRVQPLLRPGERERHLAVLGEQVDVGDAGTADRADRLGDPGREDGRVARQSALD